MEQYKDLAHIHSLNGEVREVTVLDIDRSGTQTTYIVEYNGVKCTAIFNPFAGMLYADDKYGVIKLTLEEMKNEIVNFINTNWGTSIGERVYNMYCNTWDTDYDGVKKVYDFVKEQD